MMSCFKAAADRQRIDHIPGFTKDTMDIQLKAIRDKYGCKENPKKLEVLETYLSGKIQLANVPESARAFFPNWSAFSIQTKDRPEGTDNTRTTLEALLESGETSRDKLFAFFTSKRR